MCDAGRVRHHLKYNLWRPECTVLFVGYQAVGTLGRKIHDGAKSVKLFGDEVAVHAEITALPGISGHADKQGLIDWLGAITPKPQKVFVNHGDDDATKAFVKTLRGEYQYDAFAPYSGTVYDLAANAVVFEAQPKPIQKQTGFSGKPRQVSDAFRRLVKAGEALTALIQKSEGRPNKVLASFAEAIEKLIQRFE